MNRLEEIVVGVAGAAGGLGPTVIGRLAEAGATIAATDVSEERLAELGESLGLPADRFDGRAVDLLDEAAARAWADALVERFGRVDALLHLVGGWRGGHPITEFPLEDWSWLDDLLIRTVQNTTRAFHDALLASGRGRFVLVSAKQAQHPSADNAAYAAAKAAAEAWALALADSFAKADDGAATANIVVVNAILTPQMRAESPAESFATFTPAEDIAEAIAFLLSEHAGRMNGKRLELYP